ncbi:septal ring lytic transglycosylase RlpA family protein [Niveibacterium sp. SC-1]|uniref:septal ring lytic transglycosylase RlpA family protein n=1 Tax=Niveibacterium sp. SC-1 TaxID=3135646 RepID=UPI00311DE6D1
MKVLSSRLAAPFACCALLLLAACAGTGNAPIEATPPRAEPRPESRTTPPASSKAPTRKGGGYYQDDGPDDNPPDNLDAVPDAEPRKEALHRFANNPYNVLGKDYTPETALKPYKAQGIASWYGKKFHGQRTSSGERYDMYGMTAAHPTLPIPSYARITNLANNRSVVVRINDRGPFHSNRLIDLSYTAAYKLGYISNGSTRVEVESIIPEGVDVIEANIPPIRTRAGAAALAQAERNAQKPATTPAAAAVPAAASGNGDPASILAADSGDTPPTANANASASTSPAPAPMPSKGIFLQLGAFASVANAEGFKAMVSEEVSWLADRLQIFTDAGRYRLNAGPFDTESAARAAARSLTEALKLKPFMVIR